MESAAWKALHRIACIVENFMEVRFDFLVPDGVPILPHNQPAFEPRRRRLPALTINSTSPYNETSDWQCAEVIVYSSTLSAGDITLVENYLKAKYGL